ncbi:MAG TPA: hypothetical protein VKH37_09000, partial [Ferruginibacter sp.]|nr:hypothetical protein [Ferruginibacter sp.]
MKRSLLFAIATLCSTSFLYAQSDNTEATNKIRNEGLRNSHVMDIAWHLTETGGPRLTNSPGFFRAANWAKSEMEKMGLVNVALEPWGDFGQGWEQTRCYVAMTSPYYFPIVAIPRAWTGSTPGRKIMSSDVILINAKDSAELYQNYSGKIKGKIVMFYLTDTLHPNFAKPDAERFADTTLERMAMAKLDTSRGGNRNF